MDAEWRFPMQSFKDPSQLEPGSVARREIRRERLGECLAGCRQPLRVGFVAPALLLVALVAVPRFGTAQTEARPAHDHTEQVADPRSTVQLIEGLGDHHLDIRTDVPEAQALFDQGLRLYYAFNHPESIRSFRDARRLDPECAMCWWGEALALGPNINMPMDSSANAPAHEAVRRAVDLKSNAGEAGQAMIDALTARYVAEPPEDRAPLDKAYSEAMAEVVSRFPDHADAAVLFGESVMDLQPWDYWTADGEPRPGIDEALAHFERVLEVNPDHPGACHFFIHAVEKLYPERAVPCAERLADLMPGAGHIVHMPGHIYIRVGRYLDAVEANRHATHADETYIRDQQPGMSAYTAGYYPHNYDFLAFAASMIGRSEESLAAADQVAALIPSEMMGQPGMAFLEHWTMRPLQFRVRFGRWQEILETPEPANGLLHARGLWQYARGRALAATGDLQGARQALAVLDRILADPSLEGLRMEFNPSTELLGIARAVLSGRIAAANGDLNAAVRELREAVRREDALLYGEPPEWSVPVRQELGDVLLQAERWREAEDVFEQDLDHFPDNGWSLAGLARALEGQGRNEESAEVRGRFRDVWATADVRLETGV
jgi:tetratricopeptide (TPR) repeat protein